jgi:hypothetical protein
MSGQPQSNRLSPRCSIDVEMLHLRSLLAGVDPITKAPPDRAGADALSGGGPAQWSGATINASVGNVYH